jgi:hypothetical protein
MSLQPQHRDFGHCQPSFKIVKPEEPTLVPECHVKWIEMDVGWQARILIGQSRSPPNWNDILTNKVVTSGLVWSTAQM